MGASALHRRDVLDALAAADSAHDCPAAGYLFSELVDEIVIRCVGCGETIWRE